MRHDSTSEKVEGTDTNTKGIAKVLLYKIVGGEIQFLVMKRCKADGGFWSSVNGTLERGEAPLECATREVVEETGITQPLRMSEAFCSFTFGRGESVMTATVYSAQVADSTAITLNDEHTQYDWCEVGAAIALMKFAEDKIAFTKCHDLIMGKNDV